MTTIDRIDPCGDRVLVLPDTKVGESKGGVLLNEKDQTRPQTGTIVAAGRDVKRLSKGDRVLYGKSIGTPFDLEVEEGVFETYYIMHEIEIAMRIKPENKGK